MYFGFDKISVSFGKKQILDNVSMEFEKGAFTTIIGPNGCGKSTLLKTVARTVVPQTGTAVFMDRPVSDYAPKELAKKIAYLPQIHTSPSDINIRTLVSYGRYPYKRFGQGLSEEDNQIIDRTLELTGLKSMEERLLDKLSGGEKQRAWIAMTICQQPEILMLDEPITYLDIGYQVEVMELVRNLVDTLGMTIIMVLHDMNFTSRYSDKIYVLKDRHASIYGDPERIISRGVMKDVFRIDSQLIHDEKNDCPYIIPEKLHGDDDDAKTLSINNN